MKNSLRISVGLLITVSIFFISTFLGSQIKLNFDFIPSTFSTHTLMLLLSIIFIVGFKNIVEYKFSLPKFKKIFKPILFGILTTLIVNILLAITTIALEGKIEAHPALTQMSPIQTFIFAFIYASISEEFLFRGLLSSFIINWSSL